MQFSNIRIENFKSIEEAQIESVGDLSVLIGKNDAGKSSLLEAIDMFLNENGKPDADHFHMKTTDDITISATFNDVSDDFQNTLSNSIDTAGDTLRITRKWEYPDTRRSMADTYLGSAEEKLGANTLIGEHESLGKRDTRQHIWRTLPDPVYIPAERDVSEETTFKSNTLIDQLLSPLLQDSKALRQARRELENELDGEVSGIQADIEKRLVSHVGSISRLELDTGKIDLSKAFTPSIRVTDEYSDMSVPIGERGSGIGSMLVLSLVETLRERQIGGGYLLLFEEPGNWLHPEAKRRMLGAIKEISRAGGQVMLSTHSPVFIDRRGHGDVFLVQRNSGKTSVREIKEDYLSIIEDLGSRNSDILQSDFVVYVEGSTDVQILNVVADNYLSETDRARIAVQHLGGSGNIRNCSVMELAEINRNFGFLLDSDKSNLDDSERPYISDLREEAEELDHNVLIDVPNKREIENHFTPGGINDALDLNVDDDFVGDYENIPDKLSAEIERCHVGREVQSQEERTCDQCGHIESVGDSYDKKQGKEIIRAMYERDHNPKRLEEFFDKVVERL